MKINLATFVIIMGLFSFFQKGKAEEQLKLEKPEI